MFFYENSFGHRGNGEAMRTSHLSTASLTASEQVQDYRRYKLQVLSQRPILCIPPIRFPLLDGDLDDLDATFDSSSSRTGCLQALTL
jgi:hypothetical protein